MVYYLLLYFTYTHLYIVVIRYKDKLLVLLGSQIVLALSPNGSSSDTARQ